MVNFTWLKNNKMLEDNETISIDDNDDNGDIYISVLTILDVQLPDNGLYICNATNEQGTKLSNAATLSVIGKHVHLYV